MSFDYAQENLTPDFEEVKNGGSRANSSIIFSPNLILLRENMFCIINLFAFTGFLHSRNGKGIRD